MTWQGTVRIWAQVDGRWRHETMVEYRGEHGQHTHVFHARDYRNELAYAPVLVAQDDRGHWHFVRVRHDEFGDVIENAATPMVGRQRGHEVVPGPGQHPPRYIVDLVEAVEGDVAFLGTFADPGVSAGVSVAHLQDTCATAASHADIAVTFDAWPAGPGSYSAHLSDGIGGGSDTNAGRYVDAPWADSPVHGYVGHLRNSVSTADDESGRETADADPFES